MMDNNLEKLIRGQTPDDIIKQCHQLCAQYISGKWRDIKEHQLVVRRISGGFTNQMYYCSLPDTIIDEDSNETQKVIIRIYGEKHFKIPNDDHNKRIVDVVIGLSVSHFGLGPKILGVFPSGHIQEYIPVNDKRDKFLYKKSSHFIERILQRI